MARKSRSKGKNNGFLFQLLKILLYIAFWPFALLYLLYRVTKKQLTENPEGVWYKQTWGIILVLICFYPVGVYLLWKYGKFQKKGKQIATGVFGVLCLVSLASASKTDKEVSRTMDSEQEIQNIQSVTEAVAEKETDAEIENINRTIVADEGIENTSTNVIETLQETTKPKVKEVKCDSLQTIFIQLNLGTTMSELEKMIADYDLKYSN